MNHLGPNKWVKIEPKCHKYAVKWQYFLQIQSNFWAISTHYKGYQSAYEVPRMSRGIPHCTKKIMKTNYQSNPSQNIEPKWAKNSINQVKNAV